MKDFKQCKNGHFYQNNLSECPYCPGAENNGGHDVHSDIDKTRVDGNIVDVEKTIFEGSDLEKTVVMSEVNNDPQNDSSSSQAQFDPTKTYIVGVQEDEEGTKKDQIRATRKIVGWLISYTLDEMGRDYKLYEGRNTIGKGSANNIMIPGDPSISEDHLIVLYNNLKYFISDEMSSNGTKINGNPIRPKDVIDLNDADVIEVGNTILKFRSSL